MGVSYDYDVAIIGSGPGGYVAAIRASQLGLKALVVEKDKPGGVCLNMGCIPSKSLIHQAEIYRSAKGLEEMGVTVDSSGFDYQKVFRKSRQVAERLSKGVSYLLKKNSVDYIQGIATVMDKNQLSVEPGRKITAKNILIATGSAPRDIPGFAFDGKKILSSDHALMLEKLPKSIMILGAGAIGIEFAHIMDSFGVEVTLVEMLPDILPLEDREVVQVIKRAFKRRKIRMLTSTKALSWASGKEGVEVELESESGRRDQLSVELVLVAVGRSPNTTDIGLENIGIETDRGFIPVGDYYQTGVPGVYAIGDVVDTVQLAHVASKEGEIAVEHMAGTAKEKRIDPFLIPGAVFCEPQLGSFGLKEEDAKKQAIPYKTAVFPYRGIGKAVASGRDEGLVKIVVHEETKEILGAQVVGAEATELIHQLLLAKKGELLPEDIATMIHAHPTLSEAVMEAARLAEGWAIHI